MVSSINWLYNQAMGRPSVRAERREEIVEAFARVLSEHGYAGATIVAVAEAAGIAPGLVHHHFVNKGDLLASLLETLMSRFRRRTHLFEASADPLEAYAAAAVRLDATADTIAARCWVGVFAEAVRDPALFARARRLVDTEIDSIRRRSSDRLSVASAGAVLAFIVGALVVGAFAPRKTAGFAGPALEVLVDGLAARDAGGS